MLLFPFLENLSLKWLKDRSCPSTIGVSPLKLKKINKWKPHTFSFTNLRPMLSFSLLFHLENQVCKNELKYLEIMVNKTYEKMHFI